MSILSHRIPSLHISQGFVKSLCSFCLDKFWAKGTSSHKYQLLFTDSIVLLKQKRSTAIWSQNQQKHWLFHSIIIQPRETPSESLKLRILVKNEHISPRLVNSIFLTPGGSGLERGITQGKLCAPHRTLVKILCKQSENFEGAVINYKVILSLSMRLQIVANHPLSPGLSSLWYLGFTLLCNVVSVFIPFLHDTLMLYVQNNYWRKFGGNLGYRKQGWFL